MNKLNHNPIFQFILNSAYSNKAHVSYPATRALNAQVFYFTFVTIVVRSQTKNATSGTSLSLLRLLFNQTIIVSLTIISTSVSTKVSALIDIDIDITTFRNTEHNTHNRTSVFTGVLLLYFNLFLPFTRILKNMPAKQRMRVQSEKHSKNVNIRGNVPKSEVKTLL